MGRLHIQFGSANIDQGLCCARPRGGPGGEPHAGSTLGAPSLGRPASDSILGWPGGVCASLLSHARDVWLWQAGAQVLEQAFAGSPGPWL